MDAMKAILSRRSIRKFTDKLVPEDIVTDLLQAAMSAPSAGNEQPWHFVLLTDKKILGEFSEVHPHGKMLKDTPLAILVCGDLQLEKHPGYWMQDCAASTQNILLAAHAKGLGAVWLGIYPREDRVKFLREKLGIPENVNPMALIAVGYPGERKAPEDRYDVSKVHTNKW